MANYTSVPWERQPCDQGGSWLLFQRYVILPPPRDCLALANDEWPYGALELVAKENCWEQRAYLWDQHVYRLYQSRVIEQFEAAAKDYAEHHLEILAKGRDLVDREITKLLEASKLSTTTGLLKASELTKLIETVIKYERLAHGEITELPGVFDLSALPLDKLRQMRELMLEAQALRGGMDPAMAKDYGSPPIPVSRARLNRAR